MFQSTPWSPISSQGLILWRLGLRRQPLHLLPVDVDVDVDGTAIRYSFTLDMVFFFQIWDPLPFLFFPWFLFSDLTWWLCPLLLFTLTLLLPHLVLVGKKRENVTEMKIWNENKLQKLESPLPPLVATAIGSWTQHQWMLLW